MAVGGDLFIVDNSVSDWTGLEYLRQWTELANAFDIATGFFEVGSLLALDGEWQRLDKIRILMGGEVSQRTKRALLDGMKELIRTKLDESLEGEKDENPFLTGVVGIVEAIQSGKIECRIYNKDKFHAKAYITHPKLDVVGSKALVGSSNFTRPGLTQNIELNIQVQSPSEVHELQKWYQTHWDEAVDISEDILQVIDPHVEEWRPYDVYVKALQEYFSNREARLGVWEETESTIFQKLDQYQKEAYWALMKIAEQHNGAFLCDGVGLGKTFVGLMIIERLIREKKHVVLLAPKGAKESVWEPLLKQLLPQIFNKDFSNLAIFSHTDLTRGGEFPERFRWVAEIADAVVIDEAHHFRNPGRKGGDEPWDWEKRSRYWKLFEVMSERKKQAYLLTATPINNRLTDFRHMVELFTGADDGFFARTLGIPNLKHYFGELEKKLKQRLKGDADEDGSENAVEAAELLEQDRIFKALVVQRSRAYAIESQKREYGLAAAFPQRKPPQVAEYSVFKTYGGLLKIIQEAFSKSQPLFNLSVYYPNRHYLGDDPDIDPFEETRQKNLVSLIRTQFLKRFESSIFAFEMSCDRLLKKLLAFLEVHCEADSKQQLAQWIDANEEVLLYTSQKQHDLWGEEEEGEDRELIPEDLLDKAIEEALDNEKFDVPAIIEETFQDLDQLARFIMETRKFDPAKDDKLKKLKRMLLKTNEFADKKVLIFTEFADTARYLFSELSADGVDQLELVHGGSSSARTDVVKRFAPYYNGSSSAGLENEGLKEIRVLVATDVLSEGLNLQDGTRLINYDIHWNPVRLMQRIGRVDRRMNPEVEARLKADHPEHASDRGTVAYWNFLPPSEINELLSLYKTVTRKTLMISETMGIEGKKLLTKEDELRALKEFNTAYEGERSLEETLHLDLQEMLVSDEQLQSRLNTMPGAAFSGRKKPKKGTQGVFFCYRLPAWDNNEEEWSTGAGVTQWYLYEIDSQEINEGLESSIKSVRCEPPEPRACSMEHPTLKEIRNAVRSHIKNTYLKSLNAPPHAKPELVCWMEIN